MKCLSKSAIWYGKHGWHVFPLRPHTKEPFARLGVYNATNNLQQIAAWWQRWPQANVGLHPGACGLLALDIDEYKDAYAGERFLDRLDEETITNLTGGGGTHLLYRIENSARYGNNRGGLPPGIDIRSWGGYIVLPPSIHPTGSRYEWELGYGPHEREPLLLPDGLARILEAGRSQVRQPGPPDSFAVRISAKLVETTLERLDLRARTSEYQKTGRKWILYPCPFQPVGDPHTEDSGAYIVVMPDGHIAAGCHHERCRDLLSKSKVTGWQMLTQRVQAEYA